MKSKGRSNIARVESIEHFLASAVQWQQERRIARGLAKLSEDENVELDLLLAKSTAPRAHGSHGTGALLHCECEICTHFRIYTASGGELDDAEEQRYQELYERVIA